MACMAWGIRVEVLSVPQDRTHAWYHKPDQGTLAG